MSEPEDGEPRYPSRAALPTRSSGAESMADGPVPDEAATALDRPRFTDDMLAGWGQASSLTSPPAAEPWAVMPAPRLDAKPSPAVVSTTVGTASGGGVWVASIVVAVVGGLLGALFGVWLALG